MKARPKIAYLTSSDPRDKRSWSGLHYFISKTLEIYVGEVIPLGPWQPEFTLKLGRARSLLTRKLSGKRFDYSHSVMLSKAYGKYFTERMRREKPDLIFATAASSELAFVETDVPVFYTADATFANMVNYYDFYSHLTERSLREGNETHKLALEKCTQLFYPSAWAADSAVKDYGIAKEKIHVVPFGANLEEILSGDKVRGTRENKNCQLLFLGVEWQRKGGPVALETFHELQKRGIEAELTIVGCDPGIREKGITTHRFLDKNDPAQRKKLNEIFRQTDFLVLPTKAECFGIVFCEASAFGVPSLATDTGGVAGAVENGVNGFLFPKNADGKMYADKVAEIFSEKEKLEQLRNSARKKFENELNWDSWGERIVSLI